MASNPGYRSASGADRKTSATQSRNQTAITSEHRTEKNTVLTQERITVRTRSPVKQSTEHRSGNKRTRDSERIATPVEGGKKKVVAEPRGMSFGLDTTCGQYLIVSSIVVPSSFHNCTHNRSSCFEDIGPPGCFFRPTGSSTTTPKSTFGGGSRECNH
jgi:hypothetical protein